MKEHIAEAYYLLILMDEKTKLFCLNWRKFTANDSRKKENTSIKTE